MASHDREASSEIGAGSPTSPSTAAVGESGAEDPMLRSTPKPVEHPAISFRGLAGTQWFKARHCLTLFGQLQAQSAARLCFPVQGLCHGRGTPNVAQKQHLHLKIAAFVLHL